MGSTRGKLGAWSFVVLAVGLVACDSPKTGTVDSGVTAWDYGDDPLAIRLNVEDGSNVFACGKGFTEPQVERDVADAIMDAPSFCQGSEGNYVCDCKGVAIESYAFTCPAALLEACKVVAQRVDGSDDAPPPVTECSALSREIEGTCALNDDDRFECACEADDGTIMSTTSGTGAAAVDSCDHALFDACAVSCDDDFGACAPSADGNIGEYDCECTTNGFEHVARAASCEAALLWACNPLNETDDVCTGYGGACQRSDEGELYCSCADGTVHEHVALPDAGFRSCRVALEETCGTGAAPDGAQCITEANGHHARCTRAPNADAVLTCECYADGESDARVAPVEEHMCDTALLESFCPEIAQ